MNKLLLAFFAVVFSIFSFGATFTVTNTNNTGVGSLRQAILDANGSVGRDSIVFAIAGVGVQTIQLQTELPSITEQIAINGFSQSGENTYNIVLDGTAAGYISGFLLGDYALDPLLYNVNTSLIRGIVLQNFGTAIQLAFPNEQKITIEKCKISTCYTAINLSAGANLITIRNNQFENLQSTGVYFYQVKNSTIQYNTIFNSGSLVYGSDADNLSILNNTVGNQSSYGVSLSQFKNGQVSSNNFYSNKSSIVCSECSNTIFDNNLIGEDSTGNKLGVSGNGIELQQYGTATSCTIKDNTIVNGLGSGIYIRNTTNNVISILGNKIGTKSSNVDLGNTKHGIEIDPSSGYVYVGDGTSGGQNIIAYNKLNGIQYDYGGSSPANVKISRTLIYNNTGKSINLGGAVGSINNNNKITPYIIKNTYSAGTYTLTVQTDPTDVSVEIYKGNSSFKNLLQFVSASGVNKGNGYWVFAVSSANANEYYSVLSTGTTNNTSEVGYDLTKATVVTNTNDSGPGSLRNAIVAANFVSDTSTITFAIPGFGPHIIKPIAYYPYLKYSTIIDGGHKDSIIIDGSLKNHSNAGITIGDDYSNVPSFDKYSIVKNLTIKGFYNGVAVINYQKVFIDNVISINHSNAGFSLAKTKGKCIIQNSESSNAIYGVDLFQGDTLTVQNCYIHENTQVGISIGNSCTFKYINLIGNTFSNNYDGIKSDFNNTLTDISNNLVFGNTNFGISVGRGLVRKIKGNVVGLDSTHTQKRPNKIGISTDFTVDVYIDSNIVSGNIQHGIQYSRGKVFITRNYIGTNPNGDKLGNGLSGIINGGVGTAYIGSSNIDYGNVIGDNGEYGIWSGGGWIKSNYIGITKDYKNIGNNKSGIWIGGSANGDTIYQNTICNNLEHGLHSPGSSVKYVLRNIISNNNNDGINNGGNTLTIKDNIIGVLNGLPSGNGGFGINAGFSDTLINNEIKNNLNGVSAKFTNGLIQNNIISNNIESGLLMLNGGNGNKFINNTIINNGKYGVHAVNGFSTNIFSTNTIKGNKYGLLLQNSSSNNTIINNTFGNTTKNIDVFNGSINNKISKNHFIIGDTAIDLRLLSAGPGNTSKAAPTNLAVTTGYTLTGKSAPNDTIEIFVATPPVIQTATKYLGHTKADVNGDWFYDIQGIDASITNAIVTTATDAAGNTSQLSAQILISPCTKVVTNTNDSGPGSLRACIECANVNAGTDTIKFAIPGAGPYRIKPLTAFPNIGEVVDKTTILGNSQVISQLGTGSQEIILDWNTAPSTMRGLDIFKTEIKDLTVKYSGWIKLHDSKLTRCLIDSANGGITIAGPYDPLLSGAIDSCTFSNSDISCVNFNTDGGPAVKVYITNSYFYKIKSILNGNFLGDTIIVKNNFIGQDKSGAIFPVQGGISLAVSNYSLIADNIIYTDAIEGPAIKFQVLDHVKILRNKINKVGSQSSNFSLIEVNSVDSLFIEGNTISNSYLQGINVWTNKNIWIENNTVSGNNGNGIASMNGNNDSLYITGNIVYSNGKNGIYAYANKKTTITNNIVGINGTTPAPNGLSGIFIYASNIDSVSNNRISNNRTGLTLSAVHALSGKKAVVYQNTILKNDTAIFITNSSNGLNIKNNTIDTCSAYGFYIMNGSNSSIFESNTISNSGVAGLYTNGGISNNTFISNTFTQNKTGVEMLNGSSNNTFLSNSFSSLVKNMKLYNGSSNNKLSRNTFLTADTAIYLNRNIAPGNNNKDTATISSYVQTASYIDLFGKGLNSDTIEVFNGNGIKEQTTAYVNHTKVATGTDWTLRIPVNAGYNPIANNYYLVTATDVSNNTSQLSNFIKIPLRLYSNRLNVLPNQVGICLGDSTQIDAVAEDVAYYKWYNKATGATVSTIKMPYFKRGGDYILEVGDSFGNTASDTIQIIENSLPLASDFLMASEAGIQDNIVAIDISYTKPDSLVWNWGAATAVFDTDKYLLTFPATGTYTIGLTSYLGLCAKTTSHDIHIVPGKLAPDVDSIYSSTIVSLASGPNPVTTDITFKAELAYDEIVTTYIYNLVGSLLYTYQTPIPARTHTYQIDMSAVSSGTYIVKVISGVDQRVLKIIKQ